RSGARIRRLTGQCVPAPAWPAPPPPTRLHCMRPHASPVPAGITGHVAAPVRAALSATLLALALAACASNGPVATAPAASAVVAEPALPDGAGGVPGRPATDAAAASDAVALDPATATLVPTAADGMPQDPAITSGLEAADDSGSVPTQAELDFAALYGEPAYDPVADPTLPAPATVAPPHDPWERYNRQKIGRASCRERVESGVVLGLCKGT